MSEMNPNQPTYAAALNLSQEAHKLYVFIVDRATRKDAIEVSVTNVEAISRSRCHPAKLQSVQAEIHKSGLLHVEEIYNPRHEPHQVRTKYVLLDQQNG